MIIPKEWHHLKEDWCEMISNEHEDIDAIILMGVNKANWLPKQEYDNAHNPIETKSACLM